MKIAFVFNLKRSVSIEEAEFDTQEVVDQITTALKSGGDEVIQIEMTKNGEWIDKLKKYNPDLIFNTAEGFYGIGREAYAPTLFEQLKLPYVGSGPYTCFLTLDKHLTKKVLESKKIISPPSFYISSAEDVTTICNDLDYPVFVKPNFEGSSKGITKDSFCPNSETFKTFALSSLKIYPEGLLVEKFIEGNDITIPFIEGLGDGGVLEPVEYTGTLQNNLNIYDYHMKNSKDHKIGIKCPAAIDQELKNKLISYMKTVVNVLGVNDVARGDFRVTPSGEIYFLELNALPSLQNGGALMESAKFLGLNYDQTIQAILDSAKKRNKTRPLGVTRTRAIKNRIPNLALVFNVKRKKPGDIGYEEEAEFDSPKTIEAIADAIRSNGFAPILIEADRDLSKNLQQHQIDVVFNIAEGLNKQSREAQVPAICDLLGIEHTGSDASCLCITLNKSLSSKIVQTENILAPRSIVFTHGKKKYIHNLSYPIILKPNLEGTSKGIYDNSVVDNEDDFQKLLQESFKTLKTPILCEEYISGREFTVGVMGHRTPQIIGISEIKFKKFLDQYPVYSYEAKQQSNPYENDYFSVESPPDISKVLKNKIITFAKKVFIVTGCRDIARIDFKVTKDEKIYFIEINPLPGLSPGFSDLTILADKNGMTYDALVGNIMKPAIRRWRKNK